jgi:hypothetical protein
MKLGGINVVPDRREVPWLTDSVNPTIIMGTPRPEYHKYGHPHSSHQGRTCLTLPLGHDADLRAIPHTLPS